MNEFKTVLLAVLPVFGIALIGIFVRKSNWLTEEADKSLLRLTINLLTPCLIFDSVLQNQALKQIDNLVLAPAIGLPMQLVTGYKGTADVRLAFGSGEVNGICNSWESFKATWSKELSSGELVMILQNVAKPHPDQPKLPLAIN